MTREKAIQIFIDHEIPDIQNEYEQDGIPDFIARRECWHNWLDWMCNSGEINYNQAKDWDTPDCCNQTNSRG